MYESQRQLIVDSEFTFLVFGRLESFLLLPLDDGEPFDPAVVTDAVRRGFCLCGYLGLQDDEPKVNVHPGFAGAAHTMRFAEARYREMVAARNCPPGSAEWLQNLHALADPR